jgi:hypothetical protein
MDSALDAVVSRLRMPSCQDHLCVDTAWHLEWLGVGMGWVPQGHHPAVFLPPDGS